MRVSSVNQNNNQKTNFKSITCIEKPGSLYSVSYQFKKRKDELKVLTHITDSLDLMKFEKVENPINCESEYKCITGDRIQLSSNNNKPVVTIDSCSEGIRKSSIIIDTINMSRKVKTQFDELINKLDKIN